MKTNHDITNIIAIGGSSILAALARLEYISEKAHATKRDIQIAAIDVATILQNGVDQKYILSEELAVCLGITKDQIERIKNEPWEYESIVSEVDINKLVETDKGTNGHRDAAWVSFTVNINKVKAMMNALFNSDRFFGNNGCTVRTVLLTGESGSSSLTSIDTATYISSYVKKESIQEMIGSHELIIYVNSWRVLRNKAANDSAETIYKNGVYVTVDTPDQSTVVKRGNGRVHNNELFHLVSHGEADVKSVFYMEDRSLEGEDLFRRDYNLQSQNTFDLARITYNTHFGDQILQARVQSYDYTAENEQKVGERLPVVVTGFSRMYYPGDEYVRASEHFYTKDVADILRGYGLRDSEKFTSDSTLRQEMIENQLTSCGIGSAVLDKNIAKGVPLAKDQFKMTLTGEQLEKIHESAKQIMNKNESELLESAKSRIDKFVMDDNVTTKGYKCAQELVDLLSEGINNSINSAVAKKNELENKSSDLEKAFQVAKMVSDGTTPKVNESIIQQMFRGGKIILTNQDIPSPQQIEDDKKKGEVLTTTGRFIAIHVNYRDIDRLEVKIKFLEKLEKYLIPIRKALAYCMNSIEEVMAECEEAGNKILASITSTDNNVAVHDAKDFQKHFEKYVLSAKPITKLLRKEGFATKLFDIAMVNAKNGVDLFIQGFNNWNESIEAYVTTLNVGLPLQRITIKDALKSKYPDQGERDKKLVEVFRLSAPNAKFKEEFSVNGVEISAWKTGYISVPSDNSEVAKSTEMGSWIDKTLPVSMKEQGLQYFFGDTNEIIYIREYFGLSFQALAKCEENMLYEPREGSKIKSREDWDEVIPESFFKRMAQLSLPEKILLLKFGQKIICADEKQYIILDEERTYIGKEGDNIKDLAEGDLRVMKIISKAATSVDRETVIASGKQSRRANLIKRLEATVNELFEAGDKDARDQLIALAKVRYNLEV